ncbi:hypothetical protein ACQV2E_24380, partial [Pantoea allii]|uniref:hypothetical protein n=1 Tax=Pantoea allii TaxID=574096 RepID=UPI003D3197D6
GCRTPGLLRGWREPLNPTACTDRLKLPAAWRAEHTQCKTISALPGGQNTSEKNDIAPPTGNPTSTKE